MQVNRAEDDRRGLGVHGAGRADRLESRFPVVRTRPNSMELK